MRGRRRWAAALLPRALALGVGCAWAASPAPARAAVAEDLSGLPVHAVELDVGPYRPVLSGSAEVERARATIFDDGRNWLRRHPLAYGALYGRYLYRGVGLLGPYARAGFWRLSAPARRCQDTAGATVPCTPATLASSTASNDDTAINVVPLGLGVLWRLDMPRRALGWPLAFALRAGVDYHFFWATVGDSLEVVGETGARARGGVWGVGGAAQVALALDGLGRHGSAYGSRRGRPPAYLFAEYRLVWAPGLLQRGTRLDLSDLAQVALGLALEFP